MAKTFTRIGKDIVMAVKDGGPDPDTNSRLRQVMQNSKAANMPKDNVLRAIKKASSKDTANYEEMSLEGYAIHGIAIFIDCATNNNNRTVADVRSYFSKCDGVLGTNGSLEFIFDRKGVFTLDLENVSMDVEELEMELIDGGLEELEVDEEALGDALRWEAVESRGGALFPHLYADGIPRSAIRARIELVSVGEGQYRFGERTTLE